jgi:hypothetical protein
VLQLLQQVHHHAPPHPHHPLMLNCWKVVLQLHHPLQQVVPHQLLEAVMGSLLNFELGDEQEPLLYLQALLHILKISSSS